MRNCKLKTRFQFNFLSVFVQWFAFAFCLHVVVEFTTIIFNCKILIELKRASWVISAGLSSRSIAWVFFYLCFLWMLLVFNSTTSFGKLFCYLIILRIINVFLKSGSTFFFSYFLSLILAVQPLTLTSELFVNAWLLWTSTILLALTSKTNKNKTENKSFLHQWDEILYRSTYYLSRFSWYFDKI